MTAYSVELLLQFFICIIYAELLKTVPFKGLKPAPRETPVSPRQRHTKTLITHCTVTEFIHSPIDI